MRIIAFTFFLLILYSCDSGYFCYITNNTSEAIIIKTYPPIEKFFLPDYKNYYESIKLNNELDTIPNYKINPNDTLKIFGTIGNYPSENTFPIVFIQIIADDDTLTLSTKKQVIDMLKRNKVKGRNRYLINIDSQTGTDL
jgi:hypothetical protein